MINIKVPLRIGLFGGGTDIEKFYSKEEGSVSNITIDKYIYVSVKRLNNIFEEKFRLNYSETERVLKISNIKNNIIKNTLIYNKIKSPLYISSISDVPAGTGLGSSSSFCVGLNLALGNLYNKNLSKKRIAEDACHIEINMCKSNIGKQDQYAASIQGFNNFTFTKDKVRIKNLSTKKEPIIDILNKSVLFWTGIKRDSNLILKKQNSKNNWNSSKLKLKELKKLNTSFVSMLNNFKNKEFYELLNYSYGIKEDIIKSSNKDLKKIKLELLDNKVKALKLLGAGEGGFFWCIFDSKKDLERFYFKNKEKCMMVKQSYNL